MCKYCKGYWRAGGGGTRLLQIRAGKAILQLVLDEPPEGLYNRWVKERLEYYRRVEPSAPLRDVSIVDQKVPRFRFSQTTQTGHVSNAIWELILRNPEAAASSASMTSRRGPRDDAGQRHLPAHHPAHPGGGQLPKALISPPREQRRPRLAPGEENWRGLG